MVFDKISEKIRDKIVDMRFDRAQKEGSKEQEEIFKHYMDKFDDLLANYFEIKDFKDLCGNYIGIHPESSSKGISRNEYIDFIIDCHNDGNISWNAIEEFSVKRGIVKQDFFKLPKKYDYTIGNDHISYNR